ncbi:MAG: hypothetical protein KDE51_10805, partial [Anaerolineales bacterium]|nr:hypothetical protein [Anaerolineales bacterium]
MSTEFIENPFVGPRTFSKQDRRFFFGREREARDLLALVLSERLVLFYAQSGAGKSSLINTRLLPRLVEEEGFVAFPVGRVSGQLPPDFKGDVANIFSFNLMLSLDSSDLPPEHFANLTLPEFFSRLTTADGQTYIYDPAAEPFEPSAETDEPPHILIIDQFEEIINTNLDRWSERNEFFQQLEDAMAADQFLWVVLTLREDYLAALRPYERIMLNNMRGRYYMQRMGARAARQAIEQPAQLGGRPFAEGVAQSLVDNLRQIKTQAGDEAQLGQFIEPVQLQVVCYPLWQNLAERPRQPITSEDVAQLGDVNTALAQFYEQALEAVLQETAVSEINLRNWFDHELITEAETRGTVYQGDTETAGMPNELVRLLANRFLLRAEIRAGGAWYELVHDRFVEPILEANRAWREEQAPLVRAAIAWDEAARPEELLIVGGPLTAAKQTVTAAQAEPLVAAFLAACDKADQALQEKEAQRQRELQLERERADEQARRVKTTRRMLALSLVLLVLAIGAAVFARRQQNIAIANEARAIAQTTLANAQSLQRGNQLQLSTLLAIVSLNNDGLAGAEEILRQNISRLPLIEAASQEWNDPLQDVVYSPNGEQIIIANRDQGLAVVYGTNDYQEIKRFRIPSAVVTALAIDPTSTILATNANSRRNNSYAALLFDIAAEGGVLSRNNVTETRATLEHQDAVLDMVFAADGSLIATASADQSACVWEVATGNKQQCFAVDDIVTTVLFSTDDSQLLTGGRGGHLFDVATGEELMAFPHDSYLLSAAFSPDETQIATAGTDQMVKLWDANSGELLFSAAHGGWVNRVAFSADGRWLATASNDGRVRLWDMANDFQEKQLSHEAAVISIVFSQDGRW